jgi:hypothetical protein
MYRSTFGTRRQNGRGTMRIGHGVGNALFWGSLRTGALLINVIILPGQPRAGSIFDRAPRMGDSSIATSFPSANSQLMWIWPNSNPIVPPAAFGTSLNSSMALPADADSEDLDGGNGGFVSIWQKRVTGAATPWRSIACEKLSGSIGPGGKYWNRQVGSSLPNRQVGSSLSNLLTARSRMSSVELPAGEMTPLPPEDGGGPWCRPTAVSVADSGPFPNRAVWAPILILFFGAAAFWTTRGVNLPP